MNITAEERFHRRMRLIFFAVWAVVVIACLLTMWSYAAGEEEEGKIQNAKGRIEDERKSVAAVRMPPGRYVRMEVRSMRKPLVPNAASVIVWPDNGQAFEHVDDDGKRITVRRYYTAENAQ